MTSADIRLQICRVFLGQVFLLAKERVLPGELYREICLDLMDCVSSLLGSTSPKEWAMVELRLEKHLELKTFAQQDCAEGFQYIHDIYWAFKGCEYYEETGWAFRKANDLYYEFIE